MLSKVCIKSFRRSYFRHRRSFEPANIEPGRYPHLRMQPPVDGLKSFDERMATIHPKKSIPQINIGLEFNRPKLLPLNKPVKKNFDLESSSRKKNLKLNVQESLLDKNNQMMPLLRLNMCRHAGIFESLFNQYHYFVPLYELKISYSSNESVYLGNTLTPQKTVNLPEIDYSSLPNDSLWTLLLLSPDESFDKTRQIIHYGRCNIDPKVKDSGQIFAPYFQAIPYFGTGFHRYIFLLFKQDNGKIDCSNFQQCSADEELFSKRTFSTFEFYKQFEDQITPASVQFFQAEWDKSVKKFFNNVIDIPEPIYEIKYPEELPPPQSIFPDPDNWTSHRRHPDGHPLANKRYGVFEDVSFNKYLDRYRDRKEMLQEIVKERLKMEGNPLDPEERSRKRYKFPMALNMNPEWPSWRRDVETEKRLRRGRWSELEGI